MSSWEDRLETVTMHVWERWTKNGLNLDQDEREQTLKSVGDAATNAYAEHMGDLEWYDATLARLEGRG
jgi:hypothetical protein